MNVELNNHSDNRKLAVTRWTGPVLTWLCRSRVHRSRCLRCYGAHLECDARRHITALVHIAGFLRDVYVGEIQRNLESKENFSSHTPRHVWQPGSPVNKSISARVINLGPTQGFVLCIFYWQQIYIITPNPSAL